MNCELLTTCSALGYLEEEEYFKEPDCIDTLKCLIKYVHNEDSTRTIRIQLGAAQVLQNDLLPIMSQFANDKDLFQTALRFTVNLTQPTLLCFGGKVPNDTTMHHHFLDVMSYNQAYKEAFGDHNEIWNVFAQQIYDVLETEWEDRKPEDSLLVERIIVLIRNLLHTPATSEDQKMMSTDLSSHDRLLWQMHQSGIDSLVLYMAASTTEQEWSLHVIEIICLLLKEQNAEQLAKSGTNRSAAEREKEGDELLKMRRSENSKKQQFRSKMTPWHSRFGGTYVVRGTKSIADDKDVIVHRPLRHCDKISFDDGKTKLKKARNRRPMADDSTSRRSTMTIRTMLKEFCNGLLENGYNILMRAIKDRLTREKAQDHDETYYLWAMSFFLEFNRLANFRIELVSETVQLSTLHFLDTQLINYFELMANGKQECQSWGRRMHLALCCYHEFLMTVHTMVSSNDVALKESAKVLLNNVFYIVEYREVFLMLLRRFDERKQTQRFLKDLIKTTHLFLKMFEHHCKSSTIVVQKKVRSQRRKKKSRPVRVSSTPTLLNEEDRATKWGELIDEIREKAQLPTDSENIRATDVFDPVSELTEETQQRQAVLKIQKLLLNANCEEAIKVLRTAREVWPERNIFGSADITAEQEVVALHEICLADLSNVGSTNDVIADDNEVRELSDEEDEERLPQRTKEIEFNLNEYLKKFADGKIVLPYVKLLKNFAQNKPHINHCIVKMLHRVAYDLKMYGLLFQASLFRIFQRIFEAAKLDKSLAELCGFAKWLIGKFYEVSLKNEKIFTEMLFWKNNTAEVYELVEGYGTFTVASSGARKGARWTDEEKMELQELYNKYKDEEMDVVDGILSSISDETRTRRQICHQLVEQGLADNLADLKRPKGSKQSVWREDEIEELKRLVEEYVGSPDPIGNILQMMSNKRSKQKVIEKISALGLVADRKQLFKKRAKKQRSRNTAEPVHIGGNDSDEESVANDEENISSNDEEDDTDFNESVEVLVRKCISSGYEEEVAWLGENLNGLLNDRRDPDFECGESVPIVPFSESQESAMENKHFKKLLKSVGIHPPCSEQETFWRIPPSLSDEAIGQVTCILSSSTLKRKRGASDSDSNESSEGAGSGQRRKRRAIVDDDSDGTENN